MSAIDPAAPAAAQGESPETELSIRGVTKRYGQVKAVDDLTLDIPRGSLTALLGPSGCGKTTTLRMLGGFVDSTEGQIHLRGHDIAGVPPHRRDTVMVFQHYALFPHMTVAGNLAYGLRRRKIGKRDRADRVGEMLELLGLSHLADRRPAALSGGQAQRVAVGRALILNPSVLLLDEPFSALDAQLRTSTRTELRRLQQELAITAVFVTHDQEEAMAIADQVAVMNDGRLEQVGTPQEIYENPATRFVAGFIGAANLLEGTVAETRRDAVIVTLSSGIAVSGTAGPGAVLALGAEAVVIVRPEDTTMSEPGTGILDATVETVSFLGSASELRLRTDDGTALSVRGPRSLATDHPRGSVRAVSWPTAATRILP